MRPEGDQRERKGDGVSSEETRDHEGDRAGPRVEEEKKKEERIDYYPVCDSLGVSIGLNGRNENQFPRAAEALVAADPGRFRTYLRHEQVVTPVMLEIAPVDSIKAV
ncbi:hypothetical protein An14g03960 [Aspergillus niger]|uniref:Uncharacterized protein n=1 Tax=Aspergillus niger TaxID=5061 RepID=A0A100IK77_ASPNG|nr:hypothetical protein An14g03960 [Aspergillus niger]